MVQACSWTDLGGRGEGGGLWSVSAECVCWWRGGGRGSSLLVQSVCVGGGRGGVCYCRVHVGGKRGGGGGGGD